MHILYLNFFQQRFCKTSTCVFEQALTNISYQLFRTIEIWKYQTCRFPLDFRDRILGDDPETVPSFWKNTVDAEDPRIVTHPMRVREGWERTTIPIRIHGDGVPYTKFRGLVFFVRLSCYDLLVCFYIVCFMLCFKLIKQRTWVYFDGKLIWQRP